MKILIVNISDIQGGAARAAYRLHKALLAEGLDCKLLVQNKQSDDFTVLGPETKASKVLSMARPLLESIPVRRYKNKSKTYFSSNWLPNGDIISRINKIKPDIVHLHWIGEGLMSIKDISKIDAPIVWSLHDMWPFTGGCHYDEECGRYTKSCGKCKVLGSHKEHDLSSRIFKRKRKYLSALSNLHFVGLSKWLEKSIHESALFHDKFICNLPNPIDTDTFAPVDKTIARELLNLPQKKKIIALGAIRIASDPRKGFKQLHEALDSLNPDDTELAIFGSSGPTDDSTKKFKTHYLGFLNDDISLKLLYNAADVVVVPSLQENLSNVIMESLACGTPVVGFDIGGNRDMIEHLKNGYLARPFESQDMSKGISWVIDNENYSELSNYARTKVLQEFESKKVAQKYIKLYKEILENNQKPSNA